MKKVIWAIVVVALAVGAYFLFANKPAEETPAEEAVVEEVCTGSCADCAGGCDSTALCASCDSTAVAE